MSPLARGFAAFAANEKGGAAIEMGLVSTFLCAGLLNVTELARYGYQTMEFAAASQAGAAAALAACDTAHIPATINCPNLNTAVTSAIHATSLGDQVTLKPITEGYYCLNAVQQLQYVSAPANKPADCSAANNASASPNLYLSVTVSYAYSRMFTGLTVVDAMPQQLTRSSWMRMS